MISHPRDDLAAFVLGALDARETTAISSHLASCTSCSDEVRALSETTAALAATAARDTPPGLRAAIVERARRESRGASRAGPGVILAMLRRPVPVAVPLALAVLLVVSVAGYVAARRDADRYAVAVAQVVGARVVALGPTGEIAGVRGSLVVPPDATPYLILDLPDVPQGKTWEAWVIRGATPVPAGITDARGVTTLVLSAPLAPGDTVAITIEPSGGRDRPSGNPVLSGRA